MRTHNVNCLSSLRMKKDCTLICRMRMIGKILGQLVKHLKH